jgi:hypothetical protein
MHGIFAAMGDEPVAGGFIEVVLGLWVGESAKLGLKNVSGDKAGVIPPVRAALTSSSRYSTRPDRPLPRSSLHLTSAISSLKWSPPQ